MSNQFIGIVIFGGFFMELDYKIIGQRIKDCRNERNITQNKLSELLDVSNVYVSRIERGVSKVNLEMLYRISVILDIPIGLLITGVDQDSSIYLDAEIAELMEACTPNKKKLIYELIKAVVKYE